MKLNIDLIGVVITTRKSPSWNFPQDVTTIYS